jgi:hypothetical protein
MITKATQNVISPITATGSNTPRNLDDRFADVVNVKDFGAVGDGVADDTAAIQAALNSAEISGKKNVFIPSTVSYYKITDTIQIPNGIIFEGDGYVYGGRSLIPAIVYTGNGVAITTKLGNSDTDNSRNIGIRRLRIETTGVGATGLQFVKAKSCFIDDVYILMSGTNSIGFHLKGERNSGTYFGCFYNNISKLRILGSGYADGHTGILMSGTTSDGQCNSNNFHSITIAEVDIGVNLSVGFGNFFYGLTTEFCNTNGILFDNYSQSNTVYGFYLEHVGSFAIQSNADTNYNQVYCSIVTPGGLGGNRFNLTGNRNQVYFEGRFESSGSIVYRPTSNMVSSSRNMLDFQNLSSTIISGITNTGAPYIYVPSNANVTTTGIVIDTTSYQYWRLTFIGNPNAGSITVPVNDGIDGQRLILQLSQDGVGGRIVTKSAFATNFQFAGGAYTLGTSSGNQDIIEFIRVNSKWKEISRSQSIA